MLLLLVVLLRLVAAGEADPGRVAGRRQPQAPLGQLLLGRRGRRGGRRGGVGRRRQRGRRGHHRAVADATVQPLLLLLSLLLPPLQQSTLPLG